MKKRTKMKKVKPAKRSIQRTASMAVKTQMPDLQDLMMKVHERLNQLEIKMDLVIDRTSERQPDRKPEPHPAQNHGHSQNQPRRERMLHKTVCADCNSVCEVPFKPSGERPIYCKACFSKRKAGGGKSRKPHHAPAHASHPAPTHQRRVRVIPNGAGKVTISELIPVSR